MSHYRLQTNKVSNMKVLGQTWSHCHYLMQVVYHFRSKNTMPSEQYPAFSSSVTHNALFYTPQS